MCDHLFTSFIFIAILQLVLPVIAFLIFLVYGRLKDKIKIEAQPSQEFNINPPLCQYQSQEITKLVYSPENDYFNILMTNVSKNFNVDLIVFEDEAQLNKWIRNQSEPVAAVLFEEFYAEPPKHLKYAIMMPENITASTRWNTDKLYYTGISKEPRNKSLSFKDSLYYSTCFLKLQNEIDQAFIKTVNNGSKVEKLKTLKTFPYPEVEVDVFMNDTAYGFLILFVLSMIFSAYVLIKNITIERESRLTESMKIMGLSSALYWSSWFMRSFIILIISFTINLILTVTSIISDIPMFANSNPLIIWFFFISYITSMITFCFLVSVIFKKSSRAGIVGSIIFIATVLPYMMYHDSFYRFGYGLKVLFCMLTNTNMGQGIKMILMTEINDDGVGFANLFKRSVDLKFSFGELLVWMNVGSAILMLLTIYIEKVLYEELEITKLLVMPFKHFYNKVVKKTAESSNANLKEIISTSPNAGETEQFFTNTDDSIHDQIETIKLSKKIKNKFVVQNLSLKLNKNEITVLMDNNGAGNTTVISMLTGLCQPTSGTAVINGFDIKTNIDEVRRSLSVCPQHNVLFEELTVQENLEFLCKLKGMVDLEAIQSDIKKYAKLLGIFDDLNSQVKALKDEQKRKLSIAIAFCGDSKFVILDEPTSGMDQSSRQQLRDLLNAEKQCRTILITTNFMDEADVFGDRIAVISEGQLLADESIRNFKKKFGIGYKLICVKQDGFDAQAVLDEIKKVEGSKDIAAYDADMATATDKQSESNTEAVFTISEANLPIFDKIFESLENKLKKFKILSLKCSYTSFEDVVLRMSFLNVDKSTSKHVDNSEQQTLVNIQEPKKDFSKCNKNLAILQQFYAMFLKKFYVLGQSWTMLMKLGIFSIFSILLMPILFYIHLNISNNLQISIDSYEGTEILVGIDKNLSISDHYLRLFNNKHKITITSLDFIDEPLETVNYESLIAATFKNDEIIAWFNTQPYHTMPLTINTVNRAILKSVAGSDYDITLTNHPYEKSNNKLDFIKDVATSKGNFVLNFIVILFLLIIWPMIYIGHYIKEREIRFKFLQFICSTNRLVFWFTNLIFDYILFILICLVLFGCIVCLNYDKEQQLEEFKILMTIGSSYGFSWICFIYAFSYLFSKPSSGETMLLFTSIILCILSAIDYALQAGLKNKSYNFLALIYHWIGVMFAPFTLVQMNQIATFRSRPFDYTTLDVYIRMNFVSGCIFFLIVLSLDYNFFEYLYPKLRKPKRQNLSKTILKSQYAANASNEDTNESSIYLKNLLKAYLNITAITFESRSFKIITGDEAVLSGDVWVRYENQKTKFNNFIPELTGRETLKIFALIRGIKMDEITEMINQMANELAFKQHLYKQVKAYSIKNKRKLSTALALLGNPELIFLDECTTGVDPQARRQIWNAINRIRDNHRLSSSIVITSHSMDECEALCTRIGIMVAGQFQCLGPVEDLKNKFSKGSILTIKTGFTDENKVKKLRKKIVQQFLDVELKEQYLDIFIFHLTNLELRYSEIFKMLAEVKEEMHIEDYSLTQMSLEQVFLNICKQKVQLPQEKATQIANEEARWREQEIAERKAKEAENHKISDKIETIASIRANEILKDKEEQQRIQEEEVKLAKRKLERRAIEDAVKKENEKAKQNKPKWYKVLFGRNPHKNSKLGDNALGFDVIPELGESSKKYETNKDQNIRPIDNKIKTKKDQRNEIYDKARPLDLIDSDD
ncbi:unnamed protein product [Chironomus riparius]|uniref:ABC transporter domain-containing protein n=1 Tax=Chironomus riparius TaxID=315576 RepID=A0A9N9S5G8_9DIPT|nr:unnamed protein product [Chironomus riparius]